MKKKELFSVVFDILTILIIYILLFLHIDESIVFSLKQITILGVTINICILIDYYIHNKSFKSAYFLFQFLSIPFLYGQLLTRYVFNYIPKNVFDLSILITTAGEIKAVFLIILCQLFMHLGYLLYNKKNTIYEKTVKGNIKKVLIILGSILIAISIIPAIANYTKTLNACLLNGYQGKISTSANGFTSIGGKIVPFFFIGLLCLITAYRDTEKISKILFLFGMFYYGSQIIFGNRGIPLLMVICLLWFYNYYVSKFKIRNIVIICFASMILIVTLNVIRINRSKGITEWINNFGNLFMENIVNNNPLFELNYEVGSSIYPITYTVEHIPNDINYKYGMNYLYSIYSVIRLNFSSNSNDDFKMKMNIAEEISNISGASFGGAFIQEAYANFGWYCVIFMFIFGIVLKKIDFYLNVAQSDISIIMITYFMTSLLWVIRNTMISLPREIVWYILSTYVLYLIILRRASHE